MSAGVCVAAQCDGHHQHGGGHQRCTVCHSRRACPAQPGLPRERQSEPLADRRNADNRFVFLGSMGTMASLNRAQKLVENEQKTIRDHSHCGRSCQPCGSIIITH
jgi:hypothetical protein